MVINFPRLFTKPDEIRSAPVQTAPAEGFGERVLDRMREAFCGLHGHDTMLQFEQDRMFLKCTSCGHETPGWSIHEPGPTMATQGEARRHNMARPEVVRERRIA